jgi:hypothetical protein
MKLSEEQLAQLFLAFHDGTLNAEEKILLDAYLLAHPENEQDLNFVKLQVNLDDTYLGPCLEHPQLEKLTVYATEDGHPYEKLAIAKLEGLLTNEEALLEESLAQDQLYHDIKQQVKLTKLTPNAQIVYPYQAGLLKEAKVRSLSLKKYLYWTSAAAAIFFSVFLVQQNAPEPYSKQQNNQALIGKKQKTTIEVEQTSQTQSAPKTTFKQVVIKHPHSVGPEPRDCIVAVQDFTENTPEIASQSAEINPDNSQSNQTDFTLPETTNLALQNQTSSTFKKEPITVKAFLLQKTNEKLFGTAAPTTDLKFETMARYASQTIGLPVRYEIEPGPQTDKVVFQLGPISIERNRVRK